MMRELQRIAKIVGPFAALIGLVYLIGDHHAPDVTHARLDKPQEKRWE